MKTNNLGFEVNEDGIYTKRGHAAYEHYVNLQRKPASSVRVGEFVLLDAADGRFCPVTAIELNRSMLDDVWYSALVFTNFRLMFTDKTLVRSFTGEIERQRLLKMALEFQNTLPD